MYLNSTKSEPGPTMSAHEIVSYELEFDIGKPYIPIEEEIISMLDEKDDAN